MTHRFSSSSFPSSIFKFTNFLIRFVLIFASSLFFIFSFFFDEAEHFCAASIEIVFRVLMRVSMLGEVHRWGDHHVE